MSGFMGDISGYLSAGAVNSAATTAKKSDNAYGLDMQDFLTLMVTVVMHVMAAAVEIREENDLTV